MGYYFEKASKSLLDALQEHEIPVQVWNGQKMVETSSNILAFTFSHDDVDNMFNTSSVTFVLTETNLFDEIPTIYKNSNSTRVATYIIPKTVGKDSFKIETGPNANRIICLGSSDMRRVLKSVLPVI